MGQGVKLVASPYEIQANTLCEQQYRPTSGHYCGRAGVADSNTSGLLRANLL